MSKQNLIPQIYGYIICLVTLISTIIMIPFMIDYFVDYSNPVVSSNLSSQYRSFENYKSNYLENRDSGCDHNKKKEARLKIPVPSDSALKIKYDRERKNLIDQNTYQAKKNLVSKLLWLILCTSLFFFHWKWVRKFVNKSN